jgi:multiple antibiotic resistance protein
MLQTRRERKGDPCSCRHAPIALSLTVGFGCLLVSGVASAADAVQPQVRQFPVAQVFTFLFLMLGPFKIIGPFLKMTKGADDAFARQLARRSVFFASLAVLLAAFLGETFLSKYNIPLPVLALSAGIILFLVALQNIVQQFALPGEEAATAAPAPTLKLALSPLAFPTIVTPYGIAALVVFLAFSPTPQSRLLIGAIVVAIMLLNLLVMVISRRILPVIGVVLPIVGAVLGVIQVALGLQIIHASLKILAAT